MFEKFEELEITKEAQVTICGGDGSRSGYDLVKATAG